MKYLCLVYVDLALFGALSEDARAVLAAESMVYDEELASRGQLVVADVLQHAKHAKVVQVRQGTMSRREGPFVEAREPLAGFLLIDADDLNAAIQIASKVPMARLGSIEVRPVAKVDRMEGSAA